MRKILAECLLIILVAACTQANSLEELQFSAPAIGQDSSDQNLRGSALPHGHVTGDVILLPTEPASPQPTEEALIPEPLPTPQVGLSTVGPWLLGISREEGPVAMNSDGSGLTKLFSKVSVGNAEEWLDAEISSAGWVAQIFDGVDAAPRLLITGPPNFDFVKQIPIMTAELAAEMNVITENGMKRAWTEDVYLALNSYGFIKPLSWSPDGRTLAFVAAVDGPSADVYVYDTVANEFRRLTDGPNQPKLLGWSADSRWILHLEIKDIGAGDGVWWDTVALWAATADGSEIMRVPGVEENVHFLNWSSPTLVMIVHDTYGPLPPFQIDLIDIYTGPVATIYPGSVYQWAIDPATGSIAFVVEEYEYERRKVLDPGLYMASPSRPTPLPVGSKDPDNESYLGSVGLPTWSPQLNAFMVITQDRTVAAISTSGELLRIFEGECTLPRFPVPSPDGRWLAFESCSERPARIRVHSEENGRVWEVLVGSFNDFFWSPDSSGIFYFQGEAPEQLMYVAVPEGTPRLIHPDSGLRSGYRLPQFISIGSTE